MTLQCKGVTRSGTRCKMTGSFENGYCFRHKEQADVEAMEETAIITPIKLTDVSEADVNQSAASSTKVPPVNDTPTPASAGQTADIPSAPEKPSGVLLQLLLAVAAILLVSLVFKRTKTVKRTMLHR